MGLSSRPAAWPTPLLPTTNRDSKLSDEEPKVHKRRHRSSRHGRRRLCNLSWRASFLLLLVLASVAFNALQVATWMMTPEMNEHVHGFLHHHSSNHFLSFLDRVHAKTLRYSVGPHAYKTHLNGTAAAPAAPTAAPATAAAATVHATWKERMSARAPSSPSPTSAELKAAAAAEAAAAELARPARPGERHPTYRLAFTVPWIGASFPPWMEYFLASCGRSAYLADWLIFHEDAALPDASEIPPNVIFHNLGKGGLGMLFGMKISQALGQTAGMSRLVQLFQLAFTEFSYIVTEYAAACAFRRAIRRNSL